LIVSFQKVDKLSRPIEYKQELFAGFRFCIVWKGSDVLSFTASVTQADPVKKKESLSQIWRICLNLLDCKSFSSSHDQTRIFFQVLVELHLSNLKHDDKVDF